MLKQFFVWVDKKLKRNRCENTPKINFTKIKVKNFWKQGLGMGRKEGEGNLRVA